MTVRNLLARQNAENERLLRGLEKRYDKQGEPARQFAADKIAIGQLLARQVIDRDHADMLIQRVRIKFDLAEYKRYAARQEIIGAAKARDISMYIMIGMSLMIIAWWAILDHWMKQHGF